MCVGRGGGGAAVAKEPKIKKKRRHFSKNYANSHNAAQ